MASVTSTTPLPSIAQEIAELVAEIGQNLTNNYVTMSAIAFLAYDILINLDREIEHIWKARWTVSKVLFIIGRYYGLAYVVASFYVTTTIGLSSQLYVVFRICKRWFWYQIMAGDIFFTSIVNIILILRLYAIYRNHKVLAFFVALFFVELAFELYASITLGTQASRTVFILPAGIPLAGCFANPNLKIALYAWVPCMVVATSFFCMTVVKVISDGYVTPRQLKEVKKVSPLIVLMVRDGAVFYCLILGILLVTIILIETAHGLVTGFTIQWVVVIYSLTASRLVLNLREAGNRTNFDTSQFGASKTAVSAAPVFAMNPMKRRAARDSESYFDPPLLHDEATLPF